MIPNIYTEKEIEILREGGKRLNDILNEVVWNAKVGVKINDLNTLAEKLIKEKGDVSAFLKYKPEKTSNSYPATLCVSVNDEVVHGVSKNNERILQEGDIVNFDLGLIHQGLVTDKTITVGIGKIDDRDKELINVAKKALDDAIKVARVGNTVGDIGYIIEQKAKSAGFSVVRDLGGHGVGHRVHEEPFIPNFGEKGEGIVLKEGMVLALEPIITLGNGEIFLAEDGFTYKTKDGTNCAQWEDTVLVTKTGAEILTR